MLQGHGDDAYNYKHAIAIDFSTNVWYGPEPAGLKERIFVRWHLIKKYPEVLAESLTQKISMHHNMPASRVLITNGTTESIYLIAQAYGNGKTTIAIPSFAEYEDACRMHSHQIVFINQADIHAGMQTAAGLFFICNPNNPTGYVFERLDELVKANPQTLFVIDEAFIEFTINLASLLPLINTCDNIIVLRSMTKAFAIPGLRLGYIVAPAEVIKKITRYKVPWSVNALAIEAGHHIFDNPFDNPLPLQQIFNDKEQLVQQLQELSFTIDKSHTHFFLAKLPSGTARELKEYLIGQHGMLIRDASNFRGLTEQHIRLATLTKISNAFLVDAIKEWLQPWC